MTPRLSDLDDVLEPPDHSGDPSADPASDDVEHEHDELRREAGQRLAGRWVRDRWEPPWNDDERDTQDRDGYPGGGAT